MQATTSELLVVGAALEIALAQALHAKLSGDELARLGIAVRSPADYARQFAALLDDLGRRDAVEAIAAMVVFEERLYRRKGLVTYMADECLLDIFTDTTERSPTFMLPRFRTYDDIVSPTSWAFVKDPLRPTQQAWANVLRRPPRCLNWDAEAYRQMNAPAKLRADPPNLSAVEMLKFSIGNETDASRYGVAENAAILVVEGGEVSRLAATDGQLRAAFERAARPFRERDVGDRSRAAEAFLRHVLARAGPARGLALAALRSIGIEARPEHRIDRHDGADLAVSKATGWSTSRRRTRSSSTAPRGSWRS